MKKSIALKIFGLAIGLLILMIAVAVLNSFHVIDLGREVRSIADSSLPISVRAAELNEYGLRRRIAFERLYREYQLPVKDSATIREATVNFEKFTTNIDSSILQLRAILREFPADAERLEQYARARELTSEIESTFRQQTDIARRILSKVRQGDRNIEELMRINIIGQTDLQNQRNLLQNTGSEIAFQSVQRAKQAEKRVLWSSLVVTLLALALGLSGAWILSKRLANPIVRLLKSTQDIQSGNLSINIEGLPKDEIGQLGEGMNSMLAELRKKQELQALMSTYIDPRIVEKIILPGRAEVLAGQKQIMTVLFCDIAGFTTISEQLSPTSLVKLVNSYFSIMTECIKAEGGIIDKFIGDAIMAYWGPPFIQENQQAIAACKAAISMQKAMEDFRKALPDIVGLRRNVPEMNIRIGLATGEVVAGNIGSETARSYTVMGDVVNLASRLESANKQYGTSVIISESTMRMADIRIEAMELDRILVRGKSEPVEIYELLSLEGDLPADQEQRRLRYKQALAFYRSQDWRSASAVFKELYDHYGDKTSQMFIERIRQLDQPSLGPGWDGIWRM
jgi:adenylate cyclase